MKQTLSVINLLENETIFQNDKLIVDTFNKDFCNIVKKLSIPKDPCFEDQTSNIFTDRVKASIKKYKDHPSIICIKDKISSINNSKFSFNFVSLEQTLDEINNLNPKKSSQTTGIPVPIIKGNKDVIVMFIHHNFNNSLSSSSF